MMASQCHPSRPERDPFIHCQTLAVDEFLLEDLQVCLVELKLELEVIGQFAPLAQEGNDLIHDRDKVHPAPSFPCVVPLCACATAS